MKPVVVGFVAVYLVIMLLSTYLVKVQFENDYDDTLKETLSNIQRNIYDQEDDSPEAWDDETKHLWYQSIANVYLYQWEEFMKLSFAIYDENGSLLARSANTIGTAMTPMDELLTQEVKESLAKYYGKNMELNNRLQPPRYEIQAREGDKLYELFVRELTWKRKEDLGDDYNSSHICVMSPYTDYFGNVYYPDSDEEPYTWYETDSKQIRNYVIAEMDRDISPNIGTAYMELPYIQMGYRNWKVWDSSAFLHDFTEKIVLSEWNYNNPLAGSSSWFFRKSTIVQLASDSGSDSNRYIEAHMESYPWLAAVDYMKYLYVAGFALMLACMIKIIYSSNKVYNQQEALEETRNAIDYNIQGGKILIALNKKTCIIENTGTPLSEEQLKHGFELFYSQDKSRSVKEGKHMGLGLYLAKKILDRHGLEITLENTSTGVRVMISGASK